MSRVRTQSWIAPLVLVLAAGFGAGQAAESQVYQEDSEQTVYPQKDGGVVVYSPTGGGTVTACPGGADTCTEVDCGTNREDCADILRDALDELDEEQVQSATGRTVRVNRSLLMKISQKTAAHPGQKVFVLQKNGELEPASDERERHRRDLSRVRGH